MTAPLLRFEGVAFVRDGRPILGGVDWEVRAGERWVVLGPNGAGKSTLFALAAARELPTRGRVHVLGERVGGVDLREVRPRIGVVSALLGRAIAAGQTAYDAVVTGADASLRRWRQEFTPAVRQRADELLDLVGCRPLRDHRFDTLSEGERLRVLIARALLPAPDLLLLDEPAASLDLAGRERLLEVLDRVEVPGLLLVTHRVEEIPPTATHALLLEDGRVHAAGPIDRTLTSANLSAVFDLPVQVERLAGRFVAV